jgi:integrase
MASNPLRTKVDMPLENPWFTREAYAMAVFFDKGRDRYIVRVRYNGKHVQRSFVRKPEADKYERDLLVKKDKLFVHGFNEDVTVNRLIDLYESVHLPQLKDQQQQGYTLKFIRSQLGTEKAALINRARIIAYRDTLLNKTYRGKRITKQTVNRHLACLSSVFQVAVERDLLPLNYCRGIKKFPEPKKDPVFLDVPSYKKLYEAATPWLQPIIDVAIGTGMRLGEILDLEWNRIDFNQDSIRIEKHKSEKRGDKTIYLSKMAKDVLLQIKKTSLSDLVFPSRHGKVLSKYGKVRGELRRACKRAGLTGVGFHTFRHTAASWLLMQTKDMALVKEQLGHSSLAVTQRYAHLIKEYRQIGIRGIDEFLKAA